MKYLFTFLLLLVCLSGFAQEELPSYNAMIEVSGSSRQELYGRAQQWLKQLNYQVAFDNPGSGFISVGGEVRVRQTGSGKSSKGRLVYVITLIVEEQKYWYDFAQFYYDALPSGRKAHREGQWATSRIASDNPALYRDLIAKVQAQIEDLKQTMLPGPNAPNDGVAAGNQ